MKFIINILPASLKKKIRLARNAMNIAFNQCGCGILYFYKSCSYLNTTGWLRSSTKRQVVDLNGNPILWVTYPAIHFISSRVSGDMVVFEYGSGNSTLWWAQKVKRIYSCEHDLVWYEKIKNILPDNATLCHDSLDAGYVSRISDFNNMFDVVVIDGRERVKCAYNVINALKEDGIVIWDNTDRPKYQEGINFLVSQGFKKIDFSGLSALGINSSMTSIFYRRNNCFGI